MINEPFVDFESVTPDTDIQSLNINWTEKELPEKLRTKHVHRLHPYLGKFPPQLPELFLRKFNPQVVYDPFCGSGTTLIEASALGIDSVGTDISAFNVLLSSVKSSRIDCDVLDKEMKYVLSNMRKYSSKSGFSFNDGLGIERNSKEQVNTSSEYLKSWFAETALRELLAYKKLIRDCTYENVFRIILSRAARSSRLVPHFNIGFSKYPIKNEPYYCHKHKRICVPTKSSFKFLKRYTIDSVNRISEYQKIKSNASVSVLHGDSRNVKLPKKVDMVFTSPPYIGLIDYHEQHRYAYELLGLEDKSEQEIGTAKRGVSKKARTEYIEGINNVIQHTREFMLPDAVMVIVVNDKYNLYDAETNGFTEQGKMRKEVNARTGCRKGTFYEDILIWRKQ